MWNIDRIRALTKNEVKNLRDNGLKKGRTDIVALCDEVLLESSTQTRVRKSRGQSKSTFNIPDTAAMEIAELLLKLPKTSDVSNAKNRLRWLAKPATTFTELWRHYVTCAFSSQMKSDPDTPLGRFASGSSPLLDLRAVLEQGGSPGWFANELRVAGLNRMHKKNEEILKSGRSAFSASSGGDDFLANGKSDAGLGIFVMLASGSVSDSDIATSAQFSATISTDDLYGIGHKQIRNILVNAGLAHNVLPIDSRWKNFVNGRMHFEQSDLSNFSRYLAIEDVIRKALLVVLQYRQDIPNLAVLDAMVFAVQSTNGHEGGEWTGGHMPAAITGTTT